MTLKEYTRSGGRNTSELADMLGVSTHAVRKWVYGQRSPSLKTALRIVAATDGAVELASLIGERAA